jgi:hypothetical protein
MKRIIAIGLMMGLISVAAWASVELKGGYFSPTDSDFKSIYGGGVTFGGELSFNLAGVLEVWLSGDYFKKSGSLTYTHETTDLTLIPIGAGMKYRFGSGMLEPYLGAGVRYYLYKETNPIGTVNKGGIGFLGKVGADLNFAHNLFLDIFAGYSYCKMKPADFDIQVGGIEFGAGVGYAF